MKMLKMCLNWKVIAGLAAVGVGIYAIAPETAVAALPLLILAICPLSMMLMMKGMQGDNDQRQASEEEDGEATRDGQLSRLREQRADLDEKIGALERDPDGPVMDSRGKRDTE